MNSSLLVSYSTLSSRALRTVHNSGSFGSSFNEHFFESRKFTRKLLYGYKRLGHKNIFNPLRTYSTYSKYNRKYESSDSFTVIILCLNYHV